MVRRYAKFFELGVIGLACIACAAITGVDKDYHQVDETGGSTSGGASGGTISTGGTSAKGGQGGTSAQGGTSSGGTSGGGMAGSGGIAGGGGIAGSGNVGNTGGGGTTGGGGFGGGGGQACADLGKQCVGLAPAGFSGPVVLREAAASPPACPIEYPTQAPGTLQSGFSAGTSSCSCHCTGPTNPTCSDPVLQETDNCNVAGTAKATLTPNVCKLVTLAPGKNLKVTSTFSSGSCTPQPTSSFPAPKWATEARACGGADADGTCSSGQVCLPNAPTGAPLCVYQDGNVACPTTEYTAKHLFYGGTNDTRSCSTCTCQAATGTCQGSVVFPANCSGGINYGTMAVGDCHATFSGAGAAKYTPAAPVTSCPANNVTLSGSVTAINPVTYCCKP